jgi:hypothetical protein
MNVLWDSVRWEGDSEWCVGKNLEAGDYDVLRNLVQKFSTSE